MRIFQTSEKSRYATCSIEAGTGNQFTPFSLLRLASDVSTTFCPTLTIFGLVCKRTARASVSSECKRYVCTHTSFYKLLIPTAQCSSFSAPLERPGQSRAVEIRPLTALPPDHTAYQPSVRRFVTQVPEETVGSRAPLLEANRLIRSTSPDLSSDTGWPPIRGQVQSLLHPQGQQWCVPPSALACTLGH